MKKIAWTLYIAVETILDMQMPNMYACWVAAKCQLEYGGAREFVYYKCNHARYKRIYGSETERERFKRYSSRKPCPKCCSCNDKLVNKYIIDELHARDNIIYTPDERDELIGMYGA